MTATEDHFARIERRIDSVLEAIERGDDPSDAIKVVYDAAPWDIVKLGMASLRDANASEQSADGVSDAENAQPS